MIYGNTLFSQDIGECLSPIWRIGRRVGREESVYLVISLLFAVEVMVLLFSAKSVASTLKLRIELGYIFQSRHIRSSDIGTDDGKTDEPSESKRVYLTDSKSQVRISREQQIYDIGIPFLTFHID